MNEIMKQEGHEEGEEIAKGGEVRGWVNIYRAEKFYDVGELHESRKGALLAGAGMDIVATVKVEWTEEK